MNPLYCASLVTVLAVSGIPAQRAAVVGPDQDQVWAYLSAKYDQDKNGRIEASEYDRGEDKFRRYDRDGDGVLTAADFAPGGRRPAGPQRRVVMSPERMLGRMASPADADRDGVISSDEWKRFTASKVRDGAVDVAALVPARGAAASERMVLTLTGVLDVDADGRVTADELHGVFAKLDRDGDGAIGRAELGSARPGPARQPRARVRLPQRGDSAPDFELPSVTERGETYRLSSFAGKKPVALIFGSYT